MTNKVVLRSVEEFMADYTPIYQPIYPLFLGKSQSYSEQVGEVTFKRLNAVGDIRNRRITPKDTTLHQIGSAESSKSFKKYFFAGQHTVSALQDQAGIEDFIAQVLDEHQRQADDLLLLGEGTSGSDVLNNGLFYSGDANFTTESNATVLKGTAEDHLKDMHTKIMVTAAKADQSAGEKALIIYGEIACAKFDSLYANTDAPFKEVLGKVLGPNWKLMKLPLDVTPTSTNGWITVNLSQTKLHYSALPSLKSQGVNDEKLYAWFNFLSGSMMIDCLVANAIVRQPVGTWEA